MLRILMCSLFIVIMTLSAYSYTWETDPDKPESEQTEETDSNFFFVLPSENTSHKNPSKELTLNEKFRKTLHLPKTKKIYYHNVDKSKQPVSLQHYEFISKDIKRENFKIPEPKYEPEKNIISPDPKYIVEHFNTPPGGKNINLHNLYKSGNINSQAILSPDNTKIVYTTVYSNSRNRITGYSANYIPVKQDKSIPEVLKNTYITEQEMKPIVSSMDTGIEEYKLQTLFPLDWSKDGNKIALKEQIGSTVDGVWKTNVIVYDFTTKTSTRLQSVKEAIVYWWRQNKNIDLKDYMWDIFPLGWSKENPDEIVFYAYAFTKNAPLFLGTWSVDYKDEKSNLISPESVEVEVELNGFGLKLVEYSR